MCDFTCDSSTVFKRSGCFHTADSVLWTLYISRLLLSTRILLILNTYIYEIIYENIYPNQYISTLLQTFIT